MKSPSQATRSSRGWLKNDNPPGDLQSCPRCGAKTRSGLRCQSPAMANGRCRMHGGLSTGPRTAEGLQKCRTTRLKHGRYSQDEFTKMKKSLRALLRMVKELPQS